MYCTLRDGWLNFPSHFFLAFHMTCSTCYSQERTTPHPPTKHVDKPDENSLLNTQAAIFFHFSLQVKVPLLCLRSPRHNRTRILIRPELWLFADKLQRVRAPTEDSFRRADCAPIPRSLAGHCPVWPECGWPCQAGLEDAAPSPGRQLLPGKLSSFHSTTSLQADLQHVASATASSSRTLAWGPCWVPLPQPARGPPNSGSLLLCQQPPPFLAGLQSTQHVRTLKLKSRSITAPCPVSIWVERRQRSSPLLIRKIIQTLDKAWQLTNTGQSTAGTTVPMGTGKYRAQENENCLN